MDLILPPACPSVLLDLEDPGDDVIARFRYQFSHVAIQALKMVIEPKWAKAIICENFEDFIIERHSGGDVRLIFRRAPAT
ncbi:hypothetical protein ACN9MC_31030 [Ensifer adhaerens]|uniref:hypothetical protein n=1 Tax=Ensifer adhaerens TaxID=106592 RepID=UPI003CF22942